MCSSDLSQPLSRGEKDFELSPAGKGQAEGRHRCFTGTESTQDLNYAGNESPCLVKRDLRAGDPYVATQVISQMHDARTTMTV